MSRAIRPQAPAAAGSAEADYLSLIIAGASAGIVVLDEDGCIREANDEAVRILGQSRERLIGSPVGSGLTIVGPDGAELAEDACPSAVARRTGEAQVGAVIGIDTADAGRRWVRIDARPIRDPRDGRHICMVTLVDITVEHERDSQNAMARSIAEQTLEELDTYKRALDEFAIVAVTDRRGRITYANDIFCRISGYALEELVGRSHALLNSRHHPPEFFRELWATIASGRSWHGEICNRRKDGSLYWVDTTIVPFRSAEGKVDRFVAIRHDITARIETQERLRENERRLSSVISATDVGTWEWNVRTGEMTFNERWAEIVGRRLDELQPTTIQTWIDHCHPEDWARSSDLLQRHFAGELEFYEADIRIRHKDGHWIWAHDRGRVVSRTDDGRPLVMAGTSLDVSERRLAEEAASEANRLALQKTQELEITLSHMNQGLSAFDRDGRLVMWNNRYIELFELSPDQVSVGITMTGLMDLQTRAEGQQGPDDLHRAVVETIGDGRIHRSRVTLASGRIISSTRAPAPDGGWIATHDDVTETVRSAERIAFAAHHDILTGLSNRAGLKARLGEELSATLAGGPGFNVLLIDLDRFKAVNDTFGHAVGDTLLRAVARRMLEHIRPDDMVARLGGDEFAVYQAPAENQREAAVVSATRMLQAVSAPYDIDGRQIYVGASIGVALAPEHGRDVDELLRNADSALYEVKAAGRNDFRIFDDRLEAAARERRELESDLRAALEGDQLELHYQPIVSITDQRILGMEALLRWRHPTRGYVPPDQFVPIAEQTGLIGPIGRWVIARACEDAAGWPEDIRVSINVSPAQLGQHDLVDTVTQELLRCDLAPWKVEIEVTESVLLGNDDALLGDLHQLRALGVAIALDDFGTGYSSLSYLRMFPFDRIKIDRSFVRDMESNSHCAAIVCAVSSLARSLGVTTTAEGVETEEQLTLLAAAGCTNVQGYLFGRPKPVGEIDLGGAGDGDARRRSA